MMKKKSKKKHKAPQDKVKKKEKDSTVDSDAQDLLDFGGLPDLNIKKNLGCG